MKTRGLSTVELARQIRQARADFNTSLALGDEDAYDIAINDLLHLELLTNVLFFDEKGHYPVMSFLP